MNGGSSVWPSEHVESDVRPVSSVMENGERRTLTSIRLLLFPLSPICLGNGRTGAQYQQDTVLAE